MTTLNPGTVKLMPHRGRRFSCSDATTSFDRVIDYDDGCGPVSWWCKGRIHWSIEEDTRDTPGSASLVYVEITSAEVTDAESVTVVDPLLVPAWVRAKIEEDAEFVE